MYWCGAHVDILLTSVKRCPGSGRRRRPSRRSAGRLPPWFADAAHGGEPGDGDDDSAEDEDDVDVMVLDESKGMPSLDSQLALRSHVLTG